MDRFVIFSGANERAIIAACRYFTRHKQMFSIIARPDADKIKLTSFKKNIACTRSCATLDVSDLLRHIAVLKHCYPGERLIYLPTAESINRILLAYRKQFEQAGLDVGLVDEALYMLISDKFSFQACAASNGIATPGIIADPNNASFPFVAKPKQEFSSVHGNKIYPYLIFTPQDYNRFIVSEVKDDFFFQQYISGQSFYYLMFFPDNGQPVVAYQKNLLQQSGGKSIIYAEACGCPDKKFEIKLINMLETLKFRGFIMVEVIKNNDSTVIIEANPRLWGPYELAIKQGLTPDLLITDRPSIKEASIRKGYLWLNGLLLTLTKAEKPKCYGIKFLILWGILKIHLTISISISTAWQFIVLN
ncbi:hypothetical protein COO59_18435 [Mixta theicola]|uniref:ATP-grasp domain-containing protein n=1 Tax=Mixta theicola TaxID=1458355 RepID=A0A2K1Q5A2_9GAMM|nr:hypothetical protein [Mixta theicola]PNS10219.1 hypothetical protein COO59_18435 [Mixta theicola]